MSIRILDGAIGSMLLPYGGPCVDALCLTRPGAVLDVHRQYAEAGADIITTNSLGANAIALKPFGLADRAYEIALRAAQLAKSTGRTVAGSMGPTGMMVTMAPDTFAAYDRLCEAYRTQAQGLIDGGADVLLVETVTDLLNAVAALDAIRSVSSSIPIMVSATLDRDGLLLSSQSIELFYANIAPQRPMSVGLNCGYGPDHLLSHLRRLRALAQCEVSFYPNAGLPTPGGAYPYDPASFAAAMLPVFTESLADYVGGCCGTTPAHISALKAVLNNTINRP